MAAGIALTSLAMMVWGERWHRAEVAAYGKERRPWWFYARVRVQRLPALVEIMDYSPRPLKDT